jgi:hypothetical protein
LCVTALVWQAGRGAAGLLGRKSMDKPTWRKCDLTCMVSRSSAVLDRGAKAKARQCSAEALLMWNSSRAGRMSKTGSPTSKLNVRSILCKISLVMC